MDIGQEGITVHGAIQNHRRDHAVEAQPSGKCGGLPVTMWDGGAAALPALGTAPQTRHLGGNTGLIDEDQLGGIEIGLPLEPGFTRRLHVLALLLARMRRLFLYGG